MSSPTSHFQNFHSSILGSNWTMSSKIIALSTHSTLIAKMYARNACGDRFASASALYHITPILKALHWFKINEKIKSEVLSHTFKSLKTGQLSYLRSLLTFPSNWATRFSSLITLSRPSLTSHHNILSRCFYHSAPVLWNSLPTNLRHAAYHVTPSPILNTPVSDLIHFTSVPAC